MIITNVCLLLEMLSIVICLHHLYGEKLKLDIDTVCLLAIDMIMMQVIDYFSLSGVWSILVYLFVMLYCGRKFGFKIKIICINVSLCIILVGLIQMLMTYIFCYWLDIYILVDYELLIASCVVLLIVLYVLPKCKVRKLSIFLQDKEKLLTVTIISCVTVILIWLISYKQLKVLEAYQAIALFCCIILMLMLSGQLGKYIIRVRESEAELKMHKLYEDSFHSLIDNIRLRQHEFDNHINAIYSQHYIYSTYNELVDAQKKYCQILTKENQFNKLLASGNSIIVGFLYGKFLEIDKMGIDISYKVDIKEIDKGIPTYKIIEIMGDLINNAVEALMESEKDNKLFVYVEQKDKLKIEIRNQISYVDYNEIGNFFTKGYSKKGENRGLGLYNVKRICDEYKMEVSCKSKEIDGISWLIFQVIQKEGII